MADPTGESKSEALRLDFDGRLMLRFHGSAITTDGGLPGLLAYRELDDEVALAELLRETIGRDRFPLSPRVRELQGDPGEARLTETTAGAEAAGRAGGGKEAAALTRLAQAVRRGSSLEFPYKSINQPDQFLDAGLFGIQLSDFYRLPP